MKRYELDPNAELSGAAMRLDKLDRRVGGLAEESFDSDLDAGKFIHPSAEAYIKVRKSADGQSEELVDSYFYASLLLYHCYLGREGAQTLYFVLAEYADLPPGVPQQLLNDCEALDQQAINQALQVLMLGMMNANSVET
ncbi:MAG: hypothetical protein BRC58_05925 [Cyanobacteria bacterium QS_8_64_29]|nr:MAG: hypothetical protein BRC58_05925 [Cyanobacteria bacterium QS_8_64_29]